jgi:hypothetical protein
LRVRHIVYVPEREADHLWGKIGERLIQGLFDVLYEAQVKAMNIMSLAFQGWAKVSQAQRGDRVRELFYVGRDEQNTHINNLYTTT